ncbi:MAG: amidotransferase 1, exosortase A system-associated [Planctomycetota bacterium]|nr:MAG: amidotransferase 1, exosortase A system-associated [Planctomycetota bacterium]
MCGIAGFAAAPGRQRPEQALLERMTSVIAHRGPDAMDFHLDDACGLGHRRLAIIDVSGGRNPLEDSDGHVALVFNGEIYNHELLRSELVAAGRKPRTQSDGEVILHGYLHWGLRGMLRKLRGMFAFALLDRRNGSLHLARDPLGIKPLFVSEQHGVMYFGSEMKAVLEAFAGRPQLDPRALFQCATLGYCLAPRTPYLGVESLMPGTCLSWHEGKRRVHRHHEVVFEPGRSPDDPEECWSRLGDSVQSHLMSEVPLGAFLSGGIDSSAVVTSMRERVDSVDAISVGVTSAGLDERPFAREVAEGLGVRLHEETAEPGIAELLPDLAWHLEAPYTDTSAAPTWLVCEAARRHVTVALSGDGGDENFAGYRRTRYDLLEELWRGRLPGGLRRGLLGPLGRAWPRGEWVPRPLRAGTMLRNLGGDWLDGWLHSLTRIPESAARELLRPEWQTSEPLRADVEERAAPLQDLDPLSRVLGMDLSTWLSDDILVKVDRMSMAHSLEVRVPLLDTDFVDYAAGLPSESKLRGGEGKHLLKRACRGRVPDSVLDRPKQGFHLPVNEWLRGPLAGRLNEILADGNAEVFELLDPEPLARFAQQHASGKRDRSTELWFLIATDAFLRSGPGGSER